MKKLTKLLATSLILGATSMMPLCCKAADNHKQYFNGDNCILDIQDSIGDDKGTGFYQYPQDRRLKRGTFDIKNFRVFEEGDIIVFEITMRNYIMKTWEDTGKSESQGFVANLWDIYVDIDGIPNSGYEEALPGRDVLFADKMGWEKVVMISPLSSTEVEEILRENTDHIEFQDIVDDIVIPDYVIIQGNKLTAKISKQKLPRISEKSGFQCFSMGFSNVVSANRLLNRDVKAFSTRDDFGGGSNEYGDPAVIDMITPIGVNQYELLRNHSTATFREDIGYADVPFVYAGGSRISPAVQALNRAPCTVQPPQNVVLEPVTNFQQFQQLQPSIPVTKPANNPQTLNRIQLPVTPAKQQNLAPKAVQQIPSAGNGFVPLKKNPTQTKPAYNNIPNGFVPVNKTK